MNRIILCSLVMGLAITLPAWGQTPAKKSPMKMTCEDFVATADDYRPSLIYYVAGVDRLDVSETDTIVEDTATPVATIVAECQKTPKTSFRSKVRALYKSGQVTLFDHH